MGWSQHLAAPEAQQVREIAAAAAAADGTAPLSEQVLLSLDNGSPARHFVHEGVGYANLLPAHGEHPATAEVVVAPAHRRRGIGSRLVAAAVGEGAHVWAHGDLPAAQAVAHQLGLTVARELLQLRRPLDELPEMVVPQGITLRTYAGPADDAELLRVNNAAFSWHPEQGGWTGADIAARRETEWFDPAGLFLAVAADGRIAGFHWTKVHLGTADGDVGEVYVVAVDPQVHGRGLGRVLTLAGLHHLRARGLAQAMLYVESDNAAAVRTYTRLGFSKHFSDVAYMNAASSG